MPDTSRFWDRIARDKAGTVGLIGPIGRSLGFLLSVRVFTAEELKNGNNAAGFAIEQQ